MEALTSVATVLADRGDWGHHMWDGGGWMWLWWTLMMLFWVAVIGLAVFWIARAPQSSRDSGDDRAKEILAERYARGELSTEEYRERVEALQ